MKGRTFELCHGRHSAQIRHCLSHFITRGKPILLPRKIPGKRSSTKY